MIENFSGVVQQGKKLGRQLGFPTANISYESTTLKSGTYKINGLVQGTLYHGIGVYFQENKLFEAHFFDYNGDCYSQEITIIPLVKIRENKKFEGIEQLKEQLEIDKRWAIENQWTVITFGTFDHFHEGHKYYLSNAKLYGDRLVTIIARDKTVDMVKSLTPTHSEEKRASLVKESGIVDRVQLGDTKDYYSCFVTYDPQVVCLGYDQRSFDGGIEDWYNQHESKIPEIIRLQPFNPKQFKSSYFRTKK